MDFSIAQREIEGRIKHMPGHDGKRVLSGLQSDLALLDNPSLEATAAGSAASLRDQLISAAIDQIARIARDNPGDAIQLIKHLLHETHPDRGGLRDLSHTDDAERFDRIVAISFRLLPAIAKTSGINGHMLLTLVASNTGMRIEHLGGLAGTSDNGKNIFMISKPNRAGYPAFACIDPKGGVTIAEGYDRYASRETFLKAAKKIVHRRFGSNDDRETYFTADIERAIKDRPKLSLEEAGAERIRSTPQPPQPAPFLRLITRNRV